MTTVTKYYPYKNNTRAVYTVKEKSQSRTNLVQLSLVWSVWLDYVHWFGEILYFELRRGRGKLDLEYEVRV